MAITHHMPTPTPKKHVHPIYHHSNTQVNVYSVGLYLESSSLAKLKGFKGKSKEGLAKDSSYYAVLQKPGLHRCAHV